MAIWKIALATWKPRKVWRRNEVFQWHHEMFMMHLNLRTAETNNDLVERDVIRFQQLAWALEKNNWNLNEILITTS